MADEVIYLGKDVRQPRTATAADLSGSSARPASPTSSPSKVSKAVLEDQKDSSAIPFVLYAAARATRAPEVDDDGFTLVRSRKHWVVRGRFPDEVATPPDDYVCENEFPWGPMAGGNLRKIRRWSRARKSGSVMTWKGPGYITYGSFGRDGHES